MMLIVTPGTYKKVHFLLGQGELGQGGHRVPCFSCVCGEGVPVVNGSLRGLDAVRFSFQHLAILEAR